MNPATKKWGVRGAISLAVVGGAMVTWQFYEGGNEALHHILWDGVCYPVRWGWDTLFRLLGMQGDQGMAFILPIYGSAILYFACLGFAVGAILRVLLTPHEKRG